MNNQPSLEIEYAKSETGEVYGVKIKEKFAYINADMNIDIMEKCFLFYVGEVINIKDTLMFRENLSDYEYNTLIKLLLHNLYRDAIKLKNNKYIGCSTLVPIKVFSSVEEMMVEISNIENKWDNIFKKENILKLI